MRVIAGLWFRVLRSFRRRRSCHEPHACGGCGTLSNAPASACGICGTYLCSADKNTVSCSDPGLNACGGCGALSNPPGTACGACGTFVCNAGRTAVSCSDPGFNACGGCGTLSNPPGSSCGVRGTYDCSTNKSSVFCVDCAAVLLVKREIQSVCDSFFSQVGPCARQGVGKLKLGQSRNWVKIGSIHSLVRFWYSLFGRWVGVVLEPDVEFGVRAFGCA